MPLKSERELRRTRPQYQWGAECSCQEQIEIRADRPAVIWELAALWRRMHWTREPAGSPQLALAGGEED